MSTLFFSSIRRSLVVLVLLAVFPALGIILYTGYELRDNVVRDAENFALHQVQAMAAHHERVVENARLLLMTLAKASEVRQCDIRACERLLNDMLARHTAYVSLSMADAEGRILVAAQSSYLLSPGKADGSAVQEQAAAPRMASERIDDAAYFQEALRTMAFTVGDYTLLPSERRVVVQFAQPVVDLQGMPAGVLVAAFDLSSFGRLFAETRLPEGSVFTLTDAKGMRLTRFPETEKYTWVRDLPQMIARMSGAAEEGTFLETGVDGVSRLYGFKRLRFEGASFSHLMIRLGIPVTQALAKARAVVVRNVGLLVLATILSLTTAWLVSEYAIMRRLNRLTSAAGRLEAGDLTTRTGIAQSTGELGRLAAAFDRMAEGLERKEMERQQAEDQILRLNEELEGKVEQRTEQLAAANRDLQGTLEDLRRTQSQLVMSEKLAALGELVAGVAHEINTPVGVALSAGSTLAEKHRTLADLFAKGEMKRSDLSGFLEASREGTEMIQVNLNRASELIRSFKMVAADQVSENRRVFNLRKYIDEVLLSLRPKLKKTSHRIEVVCDGDLTIESYPGAFSQILTNFIVNTLVHGYGEGQSGLIRIEAVQSGATLSLHYADDGRGMPPEVRDRIFEPFFTTARSQGSTGLGMHIVFNIVTRTLNGTIACESAPGQGTSFHLTMPV